MLSKRLVGLLALALTATLSLAACSDDEGGGGNNGGGNNGGGADVGMDVDQQDDGGGADAGTDVGQDASTGCTTDDECPGDQVCNDTNGVCEAPPSGCELTGDDRPARCDQTAEETAFDPSSVVYDFQIAGSAVDGNVDVECCFDYTGDGEMDNGLASALLGFAPSVFESVNTSISESVADGSLLLLFEHDGLTAVDSAQSYGINFFLGEYDGITELTTDGSAINPLLIDPASLDQGTYPQARIENAELTADGMLTAGPGNLTLNIDLLDTPLSLLVSQARIEAEVDQSLSSVDDGVYMTNGKLGGLVRAVDVAEGLNSFASTCTCLGLDADQELISYDTEEELLSGGATCNAGSAEAEACTGDESSCGTIASNCQLVVGLVGSLTDVDTDNVPGPDAISIGAQFQTAGAEITGVAAAE